MDPTQSQWIIEKREAVADNGMVTAMHPLAAAAGVEILRAGGNAVDAAVATAFAIGVVEPAMSGLGGVAAMVICFGSDGHSVVVDGSSSAPAGARENMFELAPATSVSGMYGWRGTVGDAQNTGYRAPVAPGQPACLLYAHEHYGSGRLSRAQVMAPAIRLAEEGFVVDPYQAQTIAFETAYRGFKLVGLSSTSGSMTAFEALNILRQFDLADLGAGSPSAVHLIAEALRRAFLDRFAYLADPQTQAVPMDALLSEDYARQIAATIGLERADPLAAAGDAWRFQRAGAGAAGRAGGGFGGDGCTTHLNVVDAERNTVALTSTLGELFGSGVVAKGTGILLNNGMTWFDPEPSHVNSIQPRKRTLWAPTPTVVLREGRPFLGIGAPGGRRIISALVQSLVNVLDFGMGVQAAVMAPRIHCEGPLTEVDGRVGPEIVDGLVARGHRLKLVEENSSSFRFARPGGIRIDPETNQLTGGVHQFTPAWAMGY